MCNLQTQRDNVSLFFIVFIDTFLELIELSTREISSWSGQEFNKIEQGCLFKKSSYDECFSIINFHYDAQGNDYSNNNDEYVIIKNSCHGSASIS